MPFNPVATLSWLASTRSHAEAAEMLGVTRATVTRYLTGIREIPTYRFTAIQRVYERTQYEQFRTRGLSPKAAAKYRGISPEATDRWLDRLETVADKWATGVASSRAKKLGKDWETLTYEEKESLLWEADAKVREGMERSPSDIGDFEEGIT